MSMCTENVVVHRKKTNVFIFKEFFYILAYICVYNFVLVCVKICASRKIDCSVQRKRCFSLPTRRCFHTILLSPSFVSTQLEKMTFQILIYLYRPISKNLAREKTKTLHFYEAVLPGMMKRITSVFHGRDEKR